MNKVLNLIINGLPSILMKKEKERKMDSIIVLNLIINGLPSIQLLYNNLLSYENNVLNLIINGLPSIQKTQVIYLQFNIQLMF